MSFGEFYRENTKLWTSESETRLILEKYLKPLGRGFFQLISQGDVNWGPQNEFQRILPRKY